MSWPNIPFGKLCNLVNGKAYKPSDWSNTGLPIVRIQNLNDHEKTFNYWEGPLERQVLVKNNDVLLAWSGTPGTSFGAHLWSRGDAVLNQHIFRVDLNNKVISKRWAIFAVNKQLYKLIEQSHGGVGLQHVTKGMVESLEIPLPPLEEQKRIAAILDKADAIRRKRQAAIKLADDFLRATFLDMFGDPVTNPKGWEVKPVGLVSLKVQDGNYGENYPRSDELLQGGEVPFLTSACVGEGGKIKSNQIRYVSKERNRNLTKVRLASRDILFTNRGANFGLSAIVPESLQGGNIGPQLTQIRVDEQVMFPEILVMILNHSGVNEKLRSLNSGSAMNFLGLTATKDFCVYCPDVTIQKKYQKISQHVSQLTSSLENYFNQSSSLFSSLSQRAFRGEL